MTQLQSEKQKQRRRGILKAIASTPVIFTLPAGAQVAAASLTCKDKSLELATTNPPRGAAANSDTWIRYKVQRKKIRISVPGSPKKKINNTFTINNQWYRVDGGIVENITESYDSDFTPVDVSGKSYYLLVDHSDYPGTGSQSYVYLGTDNQVASPIAGNSCWNSITGIPLNSNVLN